MADTVGKPQCIAPELAGLRATACSLRPGALLTFQL